MPTQPPSYSVTTWKQPMDIKPPPKRPKPPIAPPTPPVEQPIDVSVDTPQPQVSKKHLPRKRLLTIVLAGVGALLLIASVATATWYNWAISPRSDETHQVRVVVCRRLCRRRLLCGGRSGFLFPARAGPGSRGHVCRLRSEREVHL